VTTRLTELYYTVRLITGHNIAASASTQVELGDFDCVLKNGLLVARPTIEFADSDPAREALEPFLDGWSAKAEIVDGMQIEFHFAGGMETYIDADGVESPVHLTSMGLAPLYERESQYASPDPRWRDESPLGLYLRIQRREYDGDHLWSRVILGRRMLKAIEHNYGGTESAAARLRVSREIMDEVRRVVDTDERGPISDMHRHIREQDWLSGVLDALVRRVHEVDAGIPDLPPLERKDFKFVRSKG
jgi:hypothetical protein